MIILIINAKEHVLEKPSSDIINQFSIPSQPSVLIEFCKEASKENFSPDSLGDILKRDPALMAALLQLVNSPLFCLRQTITSSHQAISLLGLPRCINLVRTITLKTTLEEPIELPRFWDSATEIGRLCERICDLLTGASPEHAYSTGLFVNCGIPLMMQAYDNYLDILRETNHSHQPLSWLENNHYGLTHCRIGCELAKQWRLPERICQAILLDPVYEDVLNHNIAHPDSTDTLLAILHMAKNISADFRKLWRVYDVESEQEINPLVLSTLSISEHDFSDLHDQLIGELAAANK